jgi:MraZ protein
MAETAALIVGEFVRTIDDKYRLTLPPELAAAITPREEAACVLVKERYGALSLWNRQTWQERIESGITLVRQKIEAGRLANRLADVQQFARLLSTRFRDVRLAGRGRLVVPEGFREFLGVKPGDDCVVVGAGLCVEIWHPEEWRDYLKQEIASFGPLFEQLSS